MSKSIGENIKAIRKSLGLTQTEVAEKLYTTPQNISRVESGEGEPTAEMLIGMAEVFNVSVDTLVGRMEMPEKDLMNKLQIFFKTSENDEVSNRVFKVCESIIIGRYQKYFENTDFEGKKSYSTLLGKNLSSVFSNRTDRTRVFAAVDTSAVNLSDDSRNSLNEIFSALSNPSVLNFINNMSNFSNHETMTYDRISFCSKFDIEDKDFDFMVSSLHSLGLVTVKTVALNDSNITMYQPYLNENIVLLLALAELMYNSKSDGNIH